MILYFVRHGETDWNVKKKIQGKTDIPLNENGRRQAEQLAKELKNRQEAGTFQVVHAYTSPQLRAAETAQIAADALGVKCSKLEGLMEMDLGEWEGSNWEKIEVEYNDVYDTWNSHRRYTKTPQGESYNEVLARTLTALEQILKEQTDNVLVVTHSAVLMALRCYIDGRPFEEMVNLYRTKNAEVVEIDRQEVEEAIHRFERGI